jgi:PTS system ascorbate-specific IIA component
MTTVVIVAHAPLAGTLLAVARHVYPDCSRSLAAVDVSPEMSAEGAREAIRRAIDSLGGHEVLMLTDVFGATPCNAACEPVDGIRTRVVAGVNVPMLWRTMCYATEPLDDLVARAVAGGTQGVIQISGTRSQNQMPAGPSHDPFEHRHQQ